MVDENKVFDESEHVKMLEYIERLNSAPIGVDIPASSRPFSFLTDGRRLNIAAKERFLRCYALSGNLTASARAVGVNRHTIYQHFKEDERFHKACEDARAAYLFTLEREAYRRAVVGVLEPVFHLGRIVGYVRQFDSKLLLALMKAKGPEEYDRRSRDEDSKPAPSHRTGIARMPALTTRETTSLPIETVDE